MKSQKEINQEVTEKLKAVRELLGQVRTHLSNAYSISKDGGDRASFREFNATVEKLTSEVDRQERIIGWRTPKSFGEVKK